MLLQAQQPVQVIWPLTSDGEAVYSSGIGSASFKAGPGLSTFRYDSINGATATGWSSRNLNPTAYYEYTIVPERDATLQINQLKFEVSLSSVNMRTALYYSRDGFKQQSVPLGNTVFVGKKSSRELLVETAITVTYPETLSIRVYGWSAPTPAVSFYAGNVEFSGVIVEEEKEAAPPLEVDVDSNPIRSVLNSFPNTTPGNYTFNVTSGINSIFVECWGGGGGAGSTGNACSGGGGGAYAASLISVSPGNYNYTVGAGGAPGAEGTESIFGIYVEAAAGSSGTSSGPGGAGGTIGNSTGTTRHNGGDGGARSNQDGAGGGGGGSATPLVDGNDGTAGDLLAPGIGGPGGTGEGNGGNGGNTGASGLAGIIPGGGGGGRGYSGLSNGAGATGQVIIWYATVYNITPSGTNFCSGQTIGLSDSELDVNYQLYLGATAVGAPVEGTGNAISFGYQSALGTYTIIATMEYGGATSTMNGSVIINPVPTITLVVIPTICSGTTSAGLPYISTTGNPNQYNIDWDLTAQGQGYTDVPYTLLPTSPISLTVPAGAAPGTYNANLKVRNSATGCESVLYPISVTINPNPTIALGANPIVYVCRGEITGNLPYSGTTGNPDSYSIVWSALAIGQGFVNVPPSTSLPSSSPIVLVVPPTGAPGNYSATLKVINSITGCESVLYAFTVTIRALPSITLVIANPSVCQGVTSASITYSALTIGANRYNIDWDATAEGQGFIDVILGVISQPNPIVLTVPAGATPATYNATLTVTNTGTGCTSISYTITVTVNPVPVPTINGPNNVCVGQTATYTTEPGMSGYQWDITGGTIAIPNNTNSVLVTWTTAGPHILRVRYTNTFNCNTVNWTVLNVTVNPTIVPSPITVLPNATICNGETVTLSTTAPTGGNQSTYDYQWQSSTTGVDPWTDIPGAIGLTYTSGNLTSGISYRLEILSDPCGPTYSAIIKITVQPIIQPGTIAADQTICYNTKPNDIYELTPGVNSACGTATYKWEYSTDNGATWIPSSQTDIVYSFTGALTQTTLFRRYKGYICNGSTCYSISPSNTVKITVQGEVNPGNISGDQTICENGNPAAFDGTTVTNPPSTVTYQWQSSIDGITFNNIGGATGEDYDSGPLAVDTWFRRIVISTFGSSSCSNSSGNVIKVTVNNLSAGTIAASQTYCASGTPVPFTSTQDPTGDGSLTYQWQMSTTSALAGFTDIVGATGLTYAPAATIAWYKRIATSTLNGITCSKESNVLEIRIVDFDPMTISPATGSFCGGGDPPVLTGGAVNVISPITFIGYQWEISTDMTNWNPAGTGQNYDPLPITITTYYRRRTDVSTYGVPCSAYSNISSWTVYNKPLLTVTSPIQVCEGDIITINANATNVIDATYTLTFVSGSFNITPQTNNTGIFELDPSYLNPTPIGQQVYLVTVQNNDPLLCSDSKPVIVEIYDEPDITLTASCAPSIEQGGTITMTGVVTYPVGAQVQFSIDGGATWQLWPEFLNVPIGTHTVLARNTLAPSCISSLQGVIATQSVVTYYYDICQGLTVPPGEGLIASSLCIEWANGYGDVKTKCTDDDGTSTYVCSSSLNAPYAPGATVQYIPYMTFKAPEGTINFKDNSTLGPNQGSFSLYEYPFVPTLPDFHFVHWTGIIPDPKVLITWTGLDPDKIYVLVLNSINPTKTVCTNLQLNKGDHLQISNDIAPITWYTDPEGTDPISTQVPFDPIGGGFISNECGGSYTYYAGCATGGCMQPANFTVNPYPQVLAEDASICTGTNANIPLSSNQICNGVVQPIPVGVPVTYSWTSSLVAGTGSATGFTNCSSNCGSIINDVIVSTDPLHCPVIKYDITATSGECSGLVKTIYVTVVNNNGMTLPSPPADVTYTCSNLVPIAPVLTAIHACLPDVTATSADVITDPGSGCPSDPIVITRTWTFIDACGTESISQLITIIDNVPPTFTAPLEATVYTDAFCQYSVSPSVTGDVTDEGDNCTTSNLDATYTDNTVQNLNCENGDRFTITRTWRVADACGNFTTHDQIIHVKDNLPPTFTKPADINIYADADCDYDASVAITGDVTDEKDNCLGALNATFTDVIDETNVCHKIISRTWTLTDICGTSAAPQVQLIHVLDNTKPIFTVCPAGPFYAVIDDVVNQTYTHSGFAWDALATDNCTGTAMTYTLVHTLGNVGPVTSTTLNGAVFQKGETTVTWTATDLCGNSQTCIFKVFVYEVDITKAGPATITPGQTISYIITITNNSPTAIPLVSLTDDIPDEILIPVYSHNGSVLANWPGFIDIPSLSGTHTLIISGKVDCDIDAITTISNTAAITYAVTAVITSNTVVTEINNILTLTATPDSPDCPGAFTGGIDLEVTGGTPGYTYSWTATNGGVVPLAQQNSQDLTNIPAGTYTVIVTDANLCQKTEPYIVVDGIDNQVPTFETRGPFEFCVFNIYSAHYDGQPEPDADIVPVPPFSVPYDPDWRRPDWYVVNSNHNASFELDLDPEDIYDYCCSDAQLLNNLTWRIDFDVSLIPARTYIEGEGQPSTFDPGNDGVIDEIILWGTPDNVNKTHTITYTIVDCNNPALVTTKSTQIVIKPRPEVIKTTTP